MRQFSVQSEILQCKLTFYSDQDYPKYDCHSSYQKVQRSESYGVQYHLHLKQMFTATGLHFANWVNLEYKNDVRFTVFTVVLIKFQMLQLANTEIVGGATAHWL